MPQRSADAPPQVSELRSARDPRIARPWAVGRWRSSQHKSRSP